jgi:hypothetical protein
MTTRTKAYELCHEIMLSNSQYVPVENAGVTYLLVQICDTETTVGISGAVINPAVPENGTSAEFLRMPHDQQIAVMSLKRVTEVIQRTNHDILKIVKLASNKETWNEAAELLKKFSEEK